MQSWKGSTRNKIQHALFISGITAKTPQTRKEHTFLRAPFSVWSPSLSYCLFHPLNIIYCLVQKKSSSLSLDALLHSARERK